MGQIGWTGDESPLGKTSSVDLRRALRAMYVNADSNPVMTGGAATGRSDRRYNVASGVGVLGVGDGAVMLTWDATQTALVSQPSTSRVDVIYVDAGGAVRVGAEGAVPESQVIVLDKMVAPGGMTATTQAVRKHERNFALPYGAQHGWLNVSREFHAHGEPVQKSRHIVSELPFYCSTNRALQYTVHQSIYGEHNVLGTSFADYAPGAMLYQLFVNGELIESWEMEFNRMHQIRPHTVLEMNRSEGGHVARLERLHAWGANPLHVGGTVEKFARGRFEVVDRGVGRQ